MLELRTLGTVGLSDGRGGLPAASPKPLALLVHLAVARPRGPQRRDTLLALFHPELDHRHAHTALRQLTHALRAAVGHDVVRSDRQVVACDTERLICDVHAFEAALAAGDPSAAVAAYAGAFLSGFFLSDCPEFERWVEVERRRLERAYAGALEQLALAADAAGEADEAVARWRQLAEVDPYATRVTVRLITALELAGDRAGALHVAESHAQRLKEELDAEPSPEVEAVAQRLRVRPMPRAPVPGGSTRERLTRAVAGRYRVERVVGAGGMALVYLADDVKLGRPVALKVLRPELAAALGHERFLNEIDIAAGLAHPNILPLHDAGEADGLLYYVMPYVEGESLRARLARDGPLYAAEAVRITKEVADALAHAHARGIVHRDIKPANILLLADHAVVSDFGVARALGEAVEDRALVATTGTPAYMSPEQAAGSPDVDGRSDLYSLGCVLHEMVTGVPPPFEPTSPPVAGRTPSAPVPLISPLGEPVAAAVEAALAKALAPAPAERFATAREFAAALAAPARSRLREPRWPRGAAMVAVAGLVAAVGVLSMRGSESKVASLQPEFGQLTYEGNVVIADISADAQVLAYVVHADSNSAIVVKDLVGRSSMVIADSVSEVMTFRWSRDGTTLLFGGRFRGQWGTYSFPRLGGVPQVLSQVVYNLRSPDGARLAGWAVPAENGLEVLSLTSGERRFATIPGRDRWAGGGDWANHRDLIALVTRAGDNSAAHLWVLNLADSTHVLTLADSTGTIDSPRWAANDDALYFVKERSLYRIDVDPQTGQARGAPQHIVRLQGIEPWWGLRRPYSVSAGDQRLVYRRTAIHVNFSVARQAEGRVETLALTSGTAHNGCPTLSPDGTVLVFAREASDGVDLYRVSTSGGTPQRLTFDGSLRDCPAWGPSGKQLAYGAASAAGTRVAVLAAAGGTPRTYEDTRVSHQLAWAPGNRIAYQVPGNRNFWLLDPETGHKRPLVHNDSVGWMFDPAFSPDGRRVAVQWNRPDSGRGIWLISLDDGSQIRLSEGWHKPFGWSADGRSVFALGGRDGIVRQFLLPSGESHVISQPQVGASCLPFEHSQGLMWVCEERTTYSDVWMVENFDPEYAERWR